MSETKGKQSDPVTWDSIDFSAATGKRRIIPGGSEADDPAVTALVDEVLDTLVKFEWLCSQEDDPATPFNSKYTARERLIVERGRICDAIGHPNQPPTSESEFPTDGPKRLLNLLAVVDFKIGTNFVTTEENHAGQMYLEHALKRLELVCSDFAVDYLDGLNQLGVLWSNREEFPKSMEFLQRAERFYKDLSAGEQTKKLFLENVTEEERAMHGDKLQPNTDMARVEELYTLTAFFIAQVYGHMGKSESSAEYCQLCLQRQLNDFEVLNLVDFAYNCIGLYNYYVLCNQLVQAEYSLHAAEYVLTRGDRPASGKGFQEKEGGMPQAMAELHKTWGRFYGMLLRLGWEQYNDPDKPPYAPSELTVVYKKLPQFQLTSLRLPSSFEEALTVFKKGEHSLERSKEYFVLDGWVTDHLEVLTELSQMYANLANFESDIPRKCKMLKRKINLFEPIITELNPRVYVDTIRNLAHDLASTYQEMADLKIQDGEEGHVKKINELCFKAIRYLNMMFKTFQAPSTNEIDVGEAWMPLYISGQLALARLHTKFIYYDVAQQVQQHEVALKVYQDLVAFLKRKDPSGKTFALETRMCHEMCQLLPLKIAAIRAGQGELLRKARKTADVGV
eukprot:c15606_g1_i1.p1 GENE.c15606_g1_i1~~c15606_g1_i1.p1  ORF type:complete len:634 (+),score=169.64 c15606_g1_i1:44-1903(+)